MNKLWFYVSFSDFSPPGSKIWHFLTSDSDSLWKTVYIAKFWSKMAKSPSNWLKNIFFKIWLDLHDFCATFGHIYSFLQGIRIWGQKMPNFRARREKIRKTSVRPLFFMFLFCLCIFVWGSRGLELKIIKNICSELPVAISGLGAENARTWIVRSYLERLRGLELKFKT